MEINTAASTDDETLDSLMELFGGDEIEVSHQLAEMSGEYEERVPYIMDFLTDPKYLGKVLVDGDGELSVYPIWVKSLKEVYPTPYTTSAFELVLAGGIGLGKSTMAKIVTMYDICHFLCLKDPHKSFKLLPTTIIRFMLMNATKGLAGDVLLGEILEWIENSPFFRDKLSSRGDTMFIKKIDIGIGSRGKDALGMAVPGAIFSEINDMTVVHGQAEDVFDTITTRRESRFGRKGRPEIGHLILDSSSKGNKSFIESRLEAKRKHNRDDYRLYSYKHWDAKMHLGCYCGDTFECYAGDQHLDPFIITQEHRDNLDLMDKLEPSRLIDVPVEHQESFEFNILKSLQDLAGVSTFGTWSFITSTEKLNAVFNSPNIVKKDLIVLDFYNEDAIINYIDIDTLTMLHKSKRFIHIDLGLVNDSTGIACSYIKEFKHVGKSDPLTGGEFLTKEPVFATEWIMEIKSVPGQEVPIYKIKNFILECKKKKYPIEVVTTDGYQSTNLRQDLILRKITSELLSVDRTKEPYENLRNCILESRMHLPNSAKLKKELSELEDTGRKFDHPVDGSKDIADAVCGSVESAKRHLDKKGTLTTNEDVKKVNSALIHKTRRVGGNKPSLPGSTPYNGVGQSSSGLRGHTYD